MKEFIEKLIGRLEEEHERCINRYGIVGGNLPAMEIKQCMEIVNQLAEEYNNEFCEWTMFKANARLRHKNCMFAEDTVDPWKFNFCPYCGKKIKIAPYQPKGE